MSIHRNSFHEKFKFIRIESAERGWILSFDVVKPSIGQGHFDEPINIEKKIVFTDKETDKAFDKFKELHMFNKAAEEGSEHEAPDLSMAVSRKS